MTTAALTLIAVLGFVWLYRARSTKRWKAALDAYAEREITRDQSFPMAFSSKRASDLAIDDR